MAAVAAAPALTRIPARTRFKQFIKAHDDLTQDELIEEVLFSFASDKEIVDEALRFMTMMDRSALTTERKERTTRQIQKLNGTAEARGKQILEKLSVWEETISGKYAGILEATRPELLEKVESLRIDIAGRARHADLTEAIALNLPDDVTTVKRFYGKNPQRRSLLANIFEKYGEA